MGAEREDADEAARRGATEPGLGTGAPSQPSDSGKIPARSNGGASQPSPDPPEAEELAPVDFDALNAALGAIQPVKASIPPPDPDVETGEEEVDEEDLAGTPPARESAPRIGESQGRSSAQYASARPHTIPPTRAPVVAPDIPAVIVAEDTVPAAPPQMTNPMHPGSGPHAAVPASGPHPIASPGPQLAAAEAVASYPMTPQPFPITNALGPQPTMRMQERPRRPRTPTIVVRPRGPSTFQKLAAFMLMLVLVTMAGVAVIIWRKPAWIGLEGQPVPTAPSAGVPAFPSASTAASTTGAATSFPSAGASASASASAGASAKPPVPKKPPPPPHPTAPLPTH